MADEAQAQAADGGGKKRSLAPMLVVAGLMLGEGVGIFFLANAISGDPVPAPAAVTEDGIPADGSGLGDVAEVQVADCRPSNQSSGRLITFHIVVSVLVDAENQAEAEERAKAREGVIADRVNTIMRSAALRELNEPALGTIRRRLRTEFEQIFGTKDLIKEVLIPEIQQSGSGV